MKLFIVFQADLKEAKKDTISSKAMLDGAQSDLAKLETQKKLLEEVLEATELARASASSDAPFEELESSLDAPDRVGVKRGRENGGASGSGLGKENGGVLKAAPPGGKFFLTGRVVQESADFVREFDSKVP